MGNTLSNEQPSSCSGPDASRSPINPGMARASAPSGLVPGTALVCRLASNCRTPARRLSRQRRKARSFVMLTGRATWNSTWHRYLTGQSASDRASASEPDIPRLVPLERADGSMCTTVQYLFRCGHPATHRFRNQLCQQSKCRVCRIRDTNKFLEGECRKCQQIPQKRQQSSRFKEPAAFEDTWFIPTRCFVDIGYRTLDPFHSGTEPEEDSMSPLTSVPPPLPISPVTPKTESAWGLLTSPKSEKSPLERFFPRLRRHKKTGPCCDELSLEDALQAVRLEDFEARIEGRIMDNHCESAM